ncbi:MULTISPECIES: CopG family transcriptional regulator [Bacillus cereus group]|uniref:CopG family transcriptional regulator n=1 Tax=Bacillus thuringiensis TaxID=1428 RepID=A0A1C4EMR2_BACTU|nr:MULTISPECIES: CopG family transcriptional regulator [Bacillus cereus group]MED3024456.1 CopG family transcriptional regulator [Bacillus wiedmannii]OTY02906.1 CopG family transcriptional regulator [Bacillus thuringiensis serovar wratislaviensis]OUB61340.1 CopG family transcriptional regulator [Bacillus thuringiensis serovar sylvestriensis]SCC44810.1 Uncharacterized protein BTT61001_03345 [Bacillus thuringiensis]
MNMEVILQMLKENRATIVAKKIGISERKLLRVLKAAGYKYSRKLGWSFSATGEPPLKTDIREFIRDGGDVIRKVINEGDATTTAVNHIAQQKESVSKSSDSQKNTNPIYLLHDRARENRSKEKVSRTVNIDKEVCSKLGTVEDEYHLNRDEIVEIALYEFFEKYKV